MKVKEVIRVIKSSYPDQRHTTLREALDLSLKFLEEKEEKIKDVTSVYILSNNHLVITGIPQDDDETYNCDALGCSLNRHVLMKKVIVR